jgi:hypothetical protein
VLAVPVAVAVLCSLSSLATSRRLTYASLVADVRLWCWRGCWLLAYALVADVRVGS